MCTLQNQTYLGRVPGLSDYVEFYRQFRKQFATTGAIAPSSRFLASALTGPLRSRTQPTRVLEVGPGTGAVTRRIVDVLKPGDWLDLVELNEEFAALLRRRFESDPRYQRVNGQAKLHVFPIQDYRGDKPYDCIISGLPLNNFPPELVEEIFNVLFRLLAPGGVLSYFEYMYVRPARRLFGRNEERERLKSLEDVLSGYLGRHRVKRNWVFANLPPAWVQHLQHEPRGRA